MNLPLGITTISFCTFLDYKTSLTIHTAREARSGYFLYESYYLFACSCLFLVYSLLRSVMVLPLPCHALKADSEEAHSRLFFQSVFVLDGPRAKLFEFKLLALQLLTPINPSERRGGVECLTFSFCASYTAGSYFLLCMQYRLCSFRVQLNLKRKTLFFERSLIKQDTTSPRCLNKTLVCHWNLVRAVQHYSIRP